jgi:AmmeMemoRadiSam system protein B
MVIYMSETREYRSPGVAGSFYSRDKIILERELSMLLEASSVLNIPRPIRALIAPHAGYLYSGGVAARAYTQIINKTFSRVVVIAPSHQDFFSFISIYDGLGYETPFGEIKIDEEVSNKLVQYHQDIRFSAMGHSAKEHSIEVQLPFLQWCLSKFKIVPISMGDQSETFIETLSEALSNCLPPDDSLIVASSDLSHMHSSQIAVMLDQVAKENIVNLNAEKLVTDISNGRTEMCGYGPVAVAINTARSLGAKESKVLLYRHSGEISGNNNEVVGYLSAIFY